MRDQALHLDPEPVEATPHGGDRALEFDLFFEHERARLFRALCLVTRNRFEAEELAQDAFLAVYERWDRVREMEDSTEQLEEQDAVIRALAPLTARQRAAVVLIDLMGYSSDEAGRMLGIRASTVRTHAERAHQDLKARMERSHG